MKKISVLIAAGALMLALAVSCTPEVFTMNLQMRQPSRSGYNFSGKEMAVVYVAPDKDTLLTRNFADGFAASMGDDYFASNEAVALYRMAYDAKADYSSRDTLINVILDTGADVVFLFDSVAVNKDDIVFGDGNANVPVFARLNIYDSMGKQDTVRVFAGVSHVNVPLEISGVNSYNQMVEAAMKALPDYISRLGHKSSGQFISQWNEEREWFYYYDTIKWSNAAQSAYDFKWNKAMTAWLEIIESDCKVEEKSLAAYNLAAASYVLGDYHLAIQWLDCSDKIKKTEFSDILRFRILDAQEKSR